MRDIIHVGERHTVPYTGLKWNRTQQIKLILILGKNPYEGVVHGSVLLSGKKQIVCQWLGRSKLNTQSDKTELPGSTLFEQDWILIFLKLFSEFGFCSNVRIRSRYSRKASTVQQNTFV